MPKGTNKKPDVLKPGEMVRNSVVTEDDLSTVDQGSDFVKANEQPRKNRT